MGNYCKVRKNNQANTKKCNVFTKNSDLYDIKYCDDEEVNEYDISELLKATNKSFIPDELISLSMDFHTNFILKSEEKSKGPCLLTVCAKEVENEEELDEKRTPVDLICVVDRSGSMDGDKIKLLHNTLEFIVEHLNSEDRLSVVSFNSNAKREFGLSRMSEDKKSEFNKIINNINASGGTKISTGLDLAFKTIKERKYKNPVTSIFLLSDGQDNNNYQQEEKTSKQIENLLNKYDISDTFTIHSFGFGNDHVESVMSSISTLKGGQFYYIENVETVAESFASCLAGLLSIAAQNIKINISSFEGVKINKIIASDYLLDKTQKNTIQLSQLLVGSKKDFIFDVTVDVEKVKKSILEDKTIEILEVICNMESVSGEKQVKRHILKVKLMDETAKNDVVKSIDVLQQYQRAQGAYLMEKSYKLASNNKYDDAKILLTNIIEEINDKLKDNISEEIKLLIKDFQDVINRCNPIEQGITGDKMMSNCQTRQMRQCQNTSENINRYYCNKTQSKFNMIVNSKYSNK